MCRDTLAFTKRWHSRNVGIRDTLAFVTRWHSRNVSKCVENANMCLCDVQALMELLLSYKYHGIRTVYRDTGVAQHQSFGAVSVSSSVSVCAPMRLNQSYVRHFTLFSGIRTNALQFCGIHTNFEHACACSCRSRTNPLCLQVTKYSNACTCSLGGLTSSACRKIPD